MWIFKGTAKANTPIKSNLLLIKGDLGVLATCVESNGHLHPGIPKESL